MNINSYQLTLTGDYLLENDGSLGLPLNLQFSPTMFEKLAAGVLTHFFSDGKQVMLRVGEKTVEVNVPVRGTFVLDTERFIDAVHESMNITDEFLCNPTDVLSKDMVEFIRFMYLTPAYRMVVALDLEDEICSFSGNEEQMTFTFKNGGAVTIEKDDFPDFLQFFTL